MTAIAEYYAKVGFRTDKKSVRALDAYLASVEKRMAAMQSKMMSSLTFQSRPMTRALRDRLNEVANKVTFQIKKFDVSQKPLRESVQQAFTATSDRVPFRINKFIVDRVRLQRALMLASRDFTVNMNPSMRGGGGGAGRNAYDAAGRMELERLRHMNRLEFERLRHNNAIARSAGFGAAAGTGLLGAHGTRLPGILGGGYAGAMAIRGIGNLNQANQELISTQLTTQAVVEAHGYVGKGEETFDWLRRLGNNLGFSYMDQAQDYNSFLANALGAGQSIGGAQGIYKGFAEYQRAMGVTPARQKLVMSALSQMMGKGAVSMEELRRQMAESLPGTFSVFQDAYQTLLKRQGRGGGLTGQAAYRQLVADVSAGKVVSNELLPVVAEEMQKRAAPKLEIAKNTSQAWQGVLANQRTDWTRIASESGVEEGQRNFFRFFSQWMNQNRDIPERFGKWWEEFSEQFAIAGGFGDLIKMTLEGQETIIKEWLGTERTEQMIQNFRELSEKAKTAANFLGLVSETPKVGESPWKVASSLGADTLAFVDAVTSLNMTYDEGIGVTGTRLLKNVGGRLADNTPLGRIGRFVYGFATDPEGTIKPERDDRGYSLRYLKMTGQQPTYYPRGAELLMMGQQPAQSSTPPLVIENITLNANSGDREELTQLMTDVLRDSYERAMQGLNR